MADTPYVDNLAEPANEQTQNLPSEALLMDWETAVHRIKALFAAIRSLGNSGPGKGDLEDIIELASLGEAIIEDQLKSAD